MNTVEYIYGWISSIASTVPVILLVCVALSDATNSSPLSLKMDRIEELELSHQAKLDKILKSIQELTKEFKK